MSIIFPLAETGGSGTWTIVATVVTPVVALAGAILCVAQMRRPGANVLGGLALLLWLLGGTVGAFAILSREHLSRTGFIVALMAGGLLTVAGLVCGCIGTALHGRMRFEGGKAAAVWGIALNALLGAGGAAFFVANGAGEPNAAKPEAAAAPLDPRSAKTVTLSDANCRLSYPDAQWMQSSVPQSIEKGSALALRCVNHDLMIALTWFHDDGDALFHLKSARGRLALDNLRIEFSQETKERLGDTDFLRFECTGVLKGQALERTHTFWLTSHGGTVYFFHAPFRPASAKEAMEETRRVLSTFALMDAAKQFIRPTPAPAPTPRPLFVANPTPAHTKDSGTSDFWSAVGKAFTGGGIGGVGKFEDAKPELHGFSSALAPLGWKKSTHLDGILGAATFGAQLGATSFLVAFTIPVDGDKVDLEEFRSLWTDDRDAEQSPHPRPESKPLDMPGAKQALLVADERVMKGFPARFRLIFAKTDTRLYYFQAWQLANKEWKGRELDDALATIRLSTDPKPLPLPRIGEVQIQSNILHKLGLAASHRGEWAKALSLFQNAYRLSRHNDFTLQSIAICLIEIGDTRGALDALNASLPRVDSSPMLRAIRARVLVPLGYLLEASNDYAFAFAKGYADPDDMTIYLNALLKQSRKAEAKLVADEYVKQTGTTRAKRLKALIYSASGDRDDALKMYEDLLAQPPFDAVAAVQYGELANSLGKYDKAAKSAADLIKSGNDGVMARLIEGWGHFGKKEWREAKASFEKARTFQPNNEEVAAALLRASAMLGEGNNSSVKKPIPENEIPTATLAEIEKIGSEARPPKDANAWSPMRVTVISYRKGRPFSYTLHRKNHIADQSAVADFSTLNFPFDPLSQEIFVNRLTVTDEGGKVIAKGVPEEQYLVDQSSLGSEATHGKILRVVVPGVKPGCNVEFAMTVRERANSDEFPFQRNVVGTMHLVLAEAIILRGDVGDVRAETSAAFQKLAKKSVTSDTITWLFREPPPWHVEQLLPPTDEYMPVISLGDKKADWNKEAREYMKQIESLLAPDEETKKLALEITKGMTGNDEKILALTRHVQRNVTYQAIEFGRRARIPKPAARSLSSHYGDCKDQALLLHQLLSAAGIESHLALVNSGVATIASLPSLDQFNHMIVHVPSLKSAFVDPTDSHLPAGILSPPYFKHQALVLDPANPRLEALPERGKSPAEHLGIESDISVSADGEMQVKETLRVSGYFATGLRQWLGEVQPSDRVSSVQHWLTNARPQMHEVEVEALDKDESELILKLHYSMPRGATGDRAAADIVLPAVLERQFIVHSFAKERHNPFDVVHPIVVDSRVMLHTQNLQNPDSLRSFSRSGKSEFCNWETKALPPATKDAPVALTFHFEGMSGIFVAERYQSWQSACSGAVEAWQSPIKSQ